MIFVQSGTLELRNAPSESGKGFAPAAVTFRNSRRFVSAFCVLLRD